MVAFKPLAITIITYLAPVLGLVAFILNLLNLLAPTLVLKDSVALARIHQTPGTKGDGPTILVGMLGSCSRQNSDADMICSTLSINPNYNLTDLPSSIPAFLNAPVFTTPILAIFALAFFTLFTLAFPGWALSDRLPGNIGSPFKSQMLGKILLWTGIVGWAVLSAVYLVTCVGLGRSVDAVNLHILSMGKGAPQLHAELSNGFTMVWVAQAFAAVPVLFTFFKYRGSSSSKGKF